MTIQEDAMEFAARSQEISAILSRLREEAELCKESAGILAKEVAGYGERMAREQPEKAAVLMPILKNLETALLGLASTTLN